jgi:hypothetical protein
VPIVRRRLLSRHALQLGGLTISVVGASFSSFVVAKPPRQTCFLRPRGPPRAPGNSPPHTVVASQQLRLSHRFHPEPSPLRRSSGSPPPYSSTSKDSRPICCGSGHSPASLVACRSDASWHLHSVPPSVPKHAPCARHLVALVPPLSPCRRPASPASCALRQLRQPRRTTCPPLRSSSSRCRAIQSRPEPVKCGVRRISAFSGPRPAPVSKGVRRNPLADERGVGPQADDPAGRPTRAPGRSELLVVGRPAPADGPRRPPPTETEATCLPAALPESSTLEPSRSPRP